ncbi:unnamed protein product [Lactuca saligna]|uniref:Uncharacterized protein n=1 Tax=Lactuca saligna TaxID=75948 RepID=A0AA35ZNM2_LACSI|nr:unnamed protein product [Lactuca saligna]
MQHIKKDKIGIPIGVGITGGIDFRFLTFGGFKYLLFSGPWYFLFYVFLSVDSTFLLSNSKLPDIYPRLHLHPPPLSHLYGMCPVGIHFGFRVTASSSDRVHPPHYLLLMSTHLIQFTDHSSPHPRLPSYCYYAHPVHRFTVLSQFTIHLYRGRLESLGVMVAFRLQKFWDAKIASRIV